MVSHVTKANPKKLPLHLEKVEGESAIGGRWVGPSQHQRPRRAAAVPPLEPSRQGRQGRWRDLKRTVQGLLFVLFWNQNRNVKKKLCIFYPLSCLKVVPAFV